MGIQAANEVVDWVHSEHAYFTQICDEHYGSHTQTNADNCADYYYFPKFNKNFYYQEIQDNSIECPDLMNSFLRLFPLVSEKVKTKYRNTHKVRALQRDSGDRVVFIRPHDFLNGETKAAVAESIKLENESYVQDMRDLDRIVKDRRYRKTYTLDFVLDNPEIAREFGASPRAIRSLKPMMMNSPATCALLVQDILNVRQCHTNVIIGEDVYRKGKARALDIIRSFTASYRTDRVVADSYCQKGYFHIQSVEGDADWTIKGGLVHAELLVGLHAFACVHGPFATRALLGAELSVLGISFDMCGDEYLRYHSAEDAITSIATTIDPEVQAAIDKGDIDSTNLDLIHSISNTEGNYVASALQVSATKFLTNAHVMDAYPSLSVDRGELTPREQIASDLWVVSCDTSKGYRIWPVREPSIGEDVAIVSRIQDRLISSPVLQITSINRSSLFMSYSSDVVPGFSGGAIVAMKDGLLLGIHSGENGTSLIGCLLHPKVYNSVALESQVSQVSCITDEDTFAYELQLSFKSRGLGGVLSSVITSLFPLFVGKEHIGMAISNGKMLVTPCNVRGDAHAGIYNLNPLEMYTLDGMQVYDNLPGLEQKFPVHTRSPNKMEKVFLLGTDGAEPYVSAPTKVRDIRPDGSFLLSSIPFGGQPLTGAAVVGWDGAVLGLVGSLTSNTAKGLYSECFKFSVYNSKSRDVSFDAVNALFPYLSMSTWPEGVIEEIFTHSSCGRYTDQNKFFNAGQRPLANLGDDAAKRYLYRALRFKHTPHSEWSKIMQSLQSNAYLAEVAWKKGYAQFMRVGNGVEFAKFSKAYADLTEAFVGAVSLYEDSDTLEMFLKELSIINNW